MDLKHGTGIYVWGRSSVDNAGDKYEGQFQDGNASGVGRTTFEDGYSVCMFTHTKHEPRTEILGYKKTLKRKEKEQASAHSECEMVGFVHRGWHKGRYFKGKMHGWGIMRTGSSAMLWHNQSIGVEYFSHPINVRGFDFLLAYVPMGVPA